MKCTGLFGFLFGHKYEPRYSLGAPAIFKIDSFKGCSLAEIIESTKPKAYHGDICTRCGDIKHRDNLSHGEITK